MSRIPRGPARCSLSHCKCPRSAAFPHGWPHRRLATGKELDRNDRRCRPQAVRLLQRPAHRKLSAARRRHQRAREGARCKLSDDELRARTDDFKKQLADGKTLDDILVPAFATVREAAKRTHRPAPFRRAADRRHDPARGQDLRDEDRRRQDAGRDAAGLSQRARRPRRPRRHRQRLSRQARRRVDGPDLQLPRPDRRRDRARPRRRAAQGRLRLRRHLRHQQRARLRLSARQHEVPAWRTWSSAATSTPSSTRSTRS